jgi:hypothetical protein
MYRWYRNAKFCYAYLSDVSTSSEAHALYPITAAFKDSKWFTRCWTLQELLAPKEMMFYSKEWQPLGTKTALETHIVAATGIDVHALRGANLHDFTVAQRMSWASRREATRKEDIAYCLLGIFDIHMPLLYGEGEKSFIRLQEEILKNIEDQSIFAWKDSSMAPESSTGLLAKSPAPFSDSGRFTLLGFRNLGRPISSTNQGIQVNLFLVPYRENDDLFKACLGCADGNNSNLSPAIFLHGLSSLGSAGFYKSGEYTRVRAGELELLNGKEKSGGRKVIVNVSHTQKAMLHRAQEYRKSKAFLIEIRADVVFPEGGWDPQSKILSIDNAIGKVGGLFVDDEWKSYLLILGFSTTGKPWCRIIGCTLEDQERMWNSYVPDGKEQSTSKAILANPLKGSDGKYDINWNREFVATVEESQVYETTFFLVSTDNNNIRP